MKHFLELFVLPKARVAVDRSSGCVLPRCASLRGHLRVALPGARRPIPARAARGYLLTALTALTFTAILRLQLLFFGVKSEIVLAATAGLSIILWRLIEVPFVASF